jgi:hypothetical protein
MLRSIAAILISLVALPLLAADADLVASLSLSRPPFTGGGANAQLDITNKGPGTAVDVRATWRIPADQNLSYQIDRCTLTGTLLDCRIGDLAAGATNRVLAGVHTPKAPITMTAEVTSSSNELNVADNSTAFVITPVDVPDLVPTIRTDPPLVAGRFSRLILSIDNRGGSGARDVVAHWTIDAEVTGVGSFCTRSPLAEKTWDCTVITSLGFQGSTEFSAFLAAPQQGSVVHSSATVTSPAGDYDESNNHVTFAESVRSEADLKVSGSGATALDAGGRLRYSYTVENRSAVTGATNTQVSLSLVEGSTFVSAEGADCQIDPGSFDSHALCTLPDVPAGQSISFSFLAKPPRAVGHFRSTASVTWGDPTLKLSAFGLVQTVVYRDIAVTNTSDGGAGSLREAILEANRGCRSIENPCRITFAIPGPPLLPGGWFTIAPSPLPPVTAYELVIDGESQTAFTGDTNPRGPEVELRGAGAIPADGLVLEGNIATVRGLAINSFRGNGILGRQPASTPGLFQQFVIERNSIGVDPTGEVVVANTDRGIRLMQGSAVVQGNLIRGNGRSGVFFDHAVASVLDNRILDNGASGIFIGAEGGSSLAVKEIRGNVIAGNRDFGIAASDTLNIAVRENSIHDNGGASFDVGLDGTTSGLPGNSFAIVVRPSVTSVVYDAAAGETVVGLRTDDTSPYGNTVYTFYVFATPRRNRAGFAEAERFLAKVRVERGIRTAEVRVPGDLRAQYVTALTERFIDFGDGQVTGTSELSEGLLVP